MTTRRRANELELHRRNAVKTSSFFLVLIALSGGLPGLACRPAPGGAPAPAELAAAADCQPAPGDFAPRLQLTGEVATRDARAITVPATPIWPMKVRFLVEDGRQLAAGDTIAEFDGSQLTSRIGELEARVTTADNELEGGASRAAADLVELELSRRRLLADRDRAKILAELPPGLVSAREAAEKQLTLQRAELALQNAEAKLGHRRAAQGSALDLQQLQREEALAELAELRANLSRMVVLAPAAGVFFAGDHPREARPVQAGDDLWPGFLLGRIPSAAGWQIEARLLDVDDAKVVAGQEAAVYLDSDPGRRLHGQIRQVDQVAQEISRDSPRRAFLVLVDVAELAAGAAAGAPQIRLRPGMAARVEVAPPSRRALLLPRRCLPEWPAARGAILGCSAQDCEMAPTGSPAGGG